MDLFECIKTRRSVRRFRSTAVPEELVRRLLDAVRFSPSWANMQCWRFVVVEDPSLKEKMSELSYVESFFAPLGYKANPARKGIAEAPVVIVACADPKMSGTMGDQNYYMTDIGIAAQTLMLSARALGLGTVFVGVLQEDEIKKLLDIPEEIRVVGLFPLGYPVEDVIEPRPRKELPEIVFHEKWTGK